MNGSWTRIRRWMLAAAVLPLLAACGPAKEEGVLPQDAAPGEVVALQYGGESLLRAHPHALYRSTDGGESWEPVALPASVREGRIAAVATPPAAPGTLLIAGPGIGVVKSEDEGRTWMRLDEELPSREVAALAAHADQPGTLYAVVSGEGIYRSEDAGETWTRMDGGPGAPIRQLFHSDMKGSMQSGWLFAATPEGVRRSMDCFCGWRPTAELPEGEVFEIAFDPTQPERVYASTAQGLFRSNDGGQSWERVSTEPVATALAVDAAGTLYAADRGGAVLRSADQGSSWERPRA
jgi:photosystem II stability/assembly factor-like uncharacterized protein